MALGFLDGGAVLAAAKEAYSMWKAQEEAARKKEVVKFLKRIDFKLDQVLANQRDIIKELIQLRLFVSEELARQHLEKTVISMQSHQDALRDVSSLIEVSKDAARQRLTQLELPTKLFVYDLLREGTRAFTAILPAMIGHLSLLDLLKEAGERQSVVNALLESFVNNVDSGLRTWFDETNPIGFRGPIRGAIARRKQIEEEVAATQLRHRLGVINTGRVKNFRTEFCQIHAHQVLIVSGDLSHGFSDRVVVEDEFVSKFCWTDDDPPVPLASSDGEERSYLPSVESVLGNRFCAENISSESAIVSSSDYISVYHSANALLARDTELTAPALHPITERLNQLRAEWTQLLQVEATMTEMARIVAATRIDLARRKASG